MVITKESELVAAVLIYATRCQAEGDHPALRAMGFGPQEIEALQGLDLKDLHRAESMRAHCLHVDLNREVFLRIIARMKEHRASEKLQETLIRADAPREMMHSLFGLSAKEYTRLRRSMTLAPAVGRPAEPDDEKAHALWNAWTAVVDDEPVELLSGEDYLALKAETDVELRAIWQMTRRWAQYGNPEGRPPA